jgi:glutaredoxin
LPPLPPAVKRYLEHKGVPYTERDVTSDAQALADMQRISGVRIAPVTVVGDRAFYGDFPQQRPALERALFGERGALGS